eukprot:COSAG02_NODE_406_length_22916_cov_35.137529_1_plen_150_part_10
MYFFLCGVHALVRFIIATSSSWPSSRDSRLSTPNALLYADMVESQVELQVIEESWDGPTDDRPTLWPGIWATDVKMETDEKTSGFATTPPSTANTNTPAMSDFYDYDTTCWSTESSDALSVNPTDDANELMGAKLYQERPVSSSSGLVGT